MRMKIINLRNCDNDVLSTIQELRKTNPDMFGDYFSDDDAINYKQSPKITEKYKQNKREKRYLKDEEEKYDID